ncbi:MAG: peptidoglycan-associated lipoprotein Pal [Syntrophorhabdaceae bacterium]
MKIKSLCLILLVAFIGISLGGCGCFWQQMKGETPPPAAQPAKVQPPEQKVEVPVAAPMKDIYFDFDKYNVRDTDAAILKENMNWMNAKENKGKKVRIEGHCDERGTVEYNLVLGQKRADSAKNFMVNLGADSRLLETVSYGKEKPVDPAHNEAAWAKNRRAHFLALQ